MELNFNWISILPVLLSLMVDIVVPCRMGNSSEMRLLVHNMEMVVEVKQFLQFFLSVLQMRFFCIHIKYDSLCSAILGNPRIYSAMAMAMSIFRTVRTLVVKNVSQFDLI